MGAFVEGELHLVIDVIVYLLLLSLLSFDLFILCFKGKVEGHCPLVLTALSKNISRR
jgi:hypothetical protein